jgi:hypothetical protein
MATVAQPSHGSRCRGQNRRNEPCQRRAVTVAGFCTVHDPETGQDMRELGKRGGSTPKMTALRRAAAEHDDLLRDLAASTLERALKGENVDPQQLRAAQSLYSFKAASPPTERQQDAGSLTADGHRPCGLSDVMVFALQIGEVDADVLAAAREIVAAADGATPAKVFRESRSSETPPNTEAVPPLEPADPSSRSTRSAAKPATASTR